jgi:hypothetical protein
MVLGLRIRKEKVPTFLHIYSLSAYQYNCIEYSITKLFENLCFAAILAYTSTGVSTYVFILHNNASILRKKEIL